MKKVRFKEITDIKYGKGLPTKDRIEGNYPVFGSNGIIGKHNEFLIQPPVIIIGRKGSVGEIHLSNTPCWPIDTTYYISQGETKNDIFFLYYLLKNANLSLLSSHSAVPGLNRNDIYRNYYNLPSLIEQKCISSILCSFDKKIQLNTQMNATLEAIGQALFKRWFVDFEFPDEDGNPYKSSGGEMVDSELGPIPKGWEVDKLANLITITSGKRPNNKNDVYTEEYCYPVIGASKIMGFSNEYVYNEPILVIGRVGTHGVVQRFMTKVFPSDNTLVIKSKFYFYVYYILLNIDYASLNVGSTQPLITQTNVKNSMIILPDTKILEKYELMVKSLFERIDINDNENETLSGIRDTLLPKLMSGEIRVPVEEVAAP